MLQHNGSLTIETEPGGVVPYDQSDAITSASIPPLRLPYPVDTVVAHESIPRVDAEIGRLYLGARAVHADGMELAASSPRRPLSTIFADYRTERHGDDFSDAAFWEANFDPPSIREEAYKAPEGMSLEEYVRWVRPQFERPVTADNEHTMWLPYGTSAAGSGRFSDAVQYGWDTYFTVKGLTADGKMDRALDLVDNNDYLIRQYGYTPNAPRPTWQPGHTRLTSLMRSVH
jgi:hypothetical protein